MQHCARGFLLVVAVLLVASCSDTDAPIVPTEPTEIGTSRLMVDATSTTVVAEPVGNPFCPTVTPFNVRLGVIVRATGSFPVVVTEIRARFTDSFGRSAPQVTLPAPGPTLTFGDPRVVRTFPLILGVGCGTESRGKVIVFVDSSDGRGRRMTEQVTIDVR
jgi:hypothetical protein